MAGLSRRSTLVGGLWNVAAMVFPLVSTLLLSIVLARRLGSEQLGEMSFISYVGSLVTGIVIIAATNCSTQVMATAHGAEDHARLVALGRLSRRVHVVGGVFAGVGLASFGTIRDHGLAWALIGLVTFIDALGWSHGSRLVAQHGWRAVSPLRLVSQIAGSLLGVIAILLGGDIASVFAVQLLSSTWLALALRRRDLAGRGERAPTPARLDLRPLGRLWLLFAVAMTLSQIVEKRVELLFLDAFRSAHEVAVYSVAFSLVTVAVTVPTALLGAAMPGIAAAARVPEALHAHLRRAVRLCVLGGLLLAAGLAAVGPSVVLGFWGEELRDAATIMPWIALSVLFVPLTALCHAYWTGVGRLAPVLISTGAAAVVDLAAAAVLVPSHGLAGAVVANLAAQVVACALVVVWTHRRTSAIGMPLLVVLRSVASAALAGVAAWQASSALAEVGALVGVVVGVLVFGSVVAGIGAVLGLVPAADADWLAGTLPAAARPALVLMGGVRWARSRRESVTTVR